MVNQRKAVLGLGIDIGKNKADVCLKENSHVLESFIVSNDENGIAALLARLDPYIKDDTFMIKAAMESTGNLWINMYGALEKEGNQKAVVAVARKMLVSIYHVLTRNELYDGHRDDLKTRKVKRLESSTKARS